jgi:signal transduction histidine kinase
MYPMSSAGHHELEQLRRENAALAEQVKRLVRTESKLYLIQEELDAQRATYRLVAENERRLAEAVDVSQTLTLALECVTGGFNAERAIILFAERPGEGLSARMDEGYYLAQERAVIAALRVARDHPLVARLAAQALPIHCYADTHDPLLMALRSSFAMSEYVVLPLTRSFDERDAGLLVAGNQRGRGKFIRIDKDNELLVTLASFANHVRATIENIRGYEHIRARTLEAERANSLKSEFLATVSHELRTPLNAIIGFTRIVLRKSGSTMEPLQRENLGRVETSAFSLLSIINDILDLSKIEAGRMEIDCSPFDVCGVVKSVLAQLLPLAATKSLLLEGELPPEGVVALSDEKRFRQIVTNLLSNAIKFTREGSVRIAVAAHAERLVIEVQDTGIGIPPDELAHVFEPFHQVGGGTTREFGGTGLGLAIVSKLVVALGGSVRLRSTLAVGSTFTVDLPIGPAISERRTDRP